MKSCTIFCDIDGTIFYYRKFETYENTCPRVVKNVPSKLRDLKNKGHVLVLTTARPEKYRDLTKQELKMFNIPYDQLVMGIGRSTRYLINDMESPNEPRAISLNIIRNEGFSEQDMKLLNLPPVL